MNVYGYIRVSSREQNIARQICALKPYQIPEQNLYIDRQSGKDFHRPAYEKLVQTLKEGDLLIVKSIDRLGRNYDEILKQWRIITKEIRADILIVDMPLLDTRAKDRNRSQWTSQSSPLREFAAAKRRSCPQTTTESAVTCAPTRQTASSG